MRLKGYALSKKKDEDSWAYGGVKRRDFRHAHDEPEIPAHNGKRKNTKKWCKGKEGREHIPVRKAKVWTNRQTGEERLLYTTVVCEKCGKKLRRFSGGVRDILDL